MIEKSSINGDKTNSKNLPEPNAKLIQKLVTKIVWIIHFSKNVTLLLTLFFFFGDGSSS